MSITALLAALAILIGICLAVFEGTFLFPPLVWFILAIALNTLELTVHIGKHRE
jgi:hypothetical protein